MAGRDDIDALIARAQGGEIRAFEQLVSTHLAVVRRYARAFADQEHDADDLAQDALLKAYKSLRLFRYQSSFRTWLYTIVRSVFLDALKSRTGRDRAREIGLELPGDAGLDAAAAPDDLLSREEDRRRVWRALGRVPVEFRTALVLFDIEGCTYDEVASVENVAVGTVKSRLSRGRAHLARLLRADEERAPAAAGASPGTPSPGTWSRSPSSQGEGDGT